MMRGALAIAVFAACSSPRAPTSVVTTPCPVCEAPVAAVDVFSDLVAPEGTCKAPPPATISRADALADLAAVEHVLRRGYAGFELQAMRGVRWDRVLREMRDAIGAMKEPIATDMFGVWLADRLSVTQDHTISVTAFDKAGTPRVESAGPHDDAYVLDLVTDAQNRVTAAKDPTLVGKVVRHCESTVERRTATAKPGVYTYRQLVLAPRAPAPATCTLRDVGAGKESTATVPFRRLSVGGTGAGPAVELKGTGVPILRVRSLDEEQYEQELDQLTSFGAQNSQQPAFVIDLRGVAPGDYSFRSMFDSLLPVLPSSESQSIGSEVTAQGDVNAALCSPTEDTDLAGARAWLAELAKSREPERGWLLGRVAVAPRVGGRGPTRAYPGVLVMVVDAHCAGECEAAIKFLRALPRTVLVGENTAGRGEIDEPLRYRLPRSGLWVTAGTELHPGLTIQGRGHQPDVWLDGDKPDDAIDAIARCAADAGCARDLVKPR